MTDAARTNVLGCHKMNHDLYFTCLRYSIGDHLICTFRSRDALPSISGFFFISTVDRCVTMYHHRCDMSIAQAFMSVNPFIQYFCFLLYFLFNIVFYKLYIITKCKLNFYDLHTILDLLYKLI